MAARESEAIARLASRIVEGDQRALARAVTLIENDAAHARELVSVMHSRSGRAHVCGVTGPPGAGKSSLVESLATALRKAGRRIAIVAVDPSSPFTGGALLGDRIRMEEGLKDPSIFMRSLASRGALGGLSAAAEDVVTLLDGAGFDDILVETVGAGQSEVEIMRVAHTTIVMSVPGLGDELQAEKSGILEIADIFVVNKSDREGATRVADDLSRKLDHVHAGHPGLNVWDHDKAADRRGDVIHPRRASRFGTPSSGALSWRPPVVQTIAISKQGISELMARIFEHRQFLVESGRWTGRRRERTRDRLRQQVLDLAGRIFFDAPFSEGKLDALLGNVIAGKITLHAAAEQLLSASAG